MGTGYSSVPIQYSITYVLLYTYPLFDELYCEIEPLRRCQRYQRYLLLLFLIVHGGKMRAGADNTFFGGLKSVISTRTKAL